MKPKISIIIPIYKVEKFLERCINSIVNQTYANIEIILVDDGSPDNCPIICDSYAEKDNRIKVIHKSNGGLSDARNEGLKIATGEYILFVDSDDYIELDTCKNFIDIISYNNVDIVVGNGKKIEGNKISLMKHKYDRYESILSGKEYLKEELKSNSMFMASWLNLYNRKFLLDNKLLFKIGRLHEDEEFTPRAFLKADKVIASDINFYNYIIRNESITTKKDLSKNGIHIIKTCNELAKIYINVEDKELLMLLEESLVVKYLHAFYIGKLYKKKYKNIIKNKFLVKRAYSKKTKIKVYLLCISKHIYYIFNLILKNFNKVIINDK